MYNHNLKVANDGLLATAQAVPQNTSADGDEGAQEFSATMGAIEIIVACNANISIADTKSLTITLEDSANGTDFAPVNGVSWTKTASGAAMTYSAGDIIARLATPSTLRRYAKVKFATTDAAASGKLDAWLDFRPR